MGKDVNCREFQSWLDSDRHANDRERMERHALGCRECSLLLRVHDHLTSESLDDLEARIPDGMVDGMWQAVSGSIAKGEAETSGKSLPISWDEPTGGRRPWWNPHWLVPALAASVALLVIAGGLLFSELQEIQGRERALLLEQARSGGEGQGPDRAYASAGPGSGTSQAMQAAPRTSPAPGDVRPAWSGRAMARAVRRQTVYTVAELRALLEDAPADLLVLEPGQAEKLFQQNPFLRGAARRSEAAGVTIGDGLTAAEIETMMEKMKISPKVRVSRMRLLELTGIGPAS